MEVLIEHQNGYCWTTDCENIDDALMIIENEVIAILDNCSKDEMETMFPLLWKINYQQYGLVANGLAYGNGSLIKLEF